MVPSASHVTVHGVPARPSRLGRTWLLSLFSLWAASILLGGLEVRGLLALVLSSGLLALLQIYIRPVLFLLTLPLTVLTLGFFTLVLNGLLLLLVGALIPGFTVAGFWAAVWAVLWISLFRWLAGWILRGLSPTW